MGTTEKEMRMPKNQNQLIVRVGVEDFSAGQKGSPREGQQHQQPQQHQKSVKKGEGADFEVFFKPPANHGRCLRMSGGGVARLFLV